MVCTNQSASRILQEESNEFIRRNGAYLRCRSSLPRSKGIRHHQGPPRRGPLQRFHTERMLCYFQSPPSRYAAHSSPGWTGHGSASALQGKRARHRPKQSITKNYSFFFFFKQYKAISAASLTAVHFLEIRCNTVSVPFRVSFLPHV